MKYIVYLTKNIINNKIYIGVHQTENPLVWDYYIGDGAFANKPSSYNKQKTPFHSAICKYGVDNFKRRILKVFDTKEDALKLEARIVNEDFIKRKDVYNCTVGGGYPPRHDKKVFQYSLSGEFLNEYSSITVASEKNKIYNGGIRIGISQKRSIGGYFWSFNKYDNLDIKEFTITTHKTEVLVYNKDLELLNEFESIADAARFYEFDAKSISTAIFENDCLHGLIFINANKTIDDFIQQRKNRVKVCKVPVYKYCPITGNLLDSYTSVAEAKQSNNLKSHAPIVRAIKNKSKSANCYWSYYKVNNFFKDYVSTENPKPKQIAQYDENDNIIKIWDIDECRKLYPNCIKVCRGARNKAYGYKWKYILK